MAKTPERWDVEDQQFWETEGKTVATRNLWVSIPNLLCGFATWIIWGMVAKMISKLHFDSIAALRDGKVGEALDHPGVLFNFRIGGELLDKGGYESLIMLLPAIAGLAGATLRIPNSFMIAICGGRNVKFLTTVMMILPAFAAGMALKDPTTSFYVFVILAVLAGVGGGAFASSMSNISFFFPKRMQGLALGLNAGIGNLGVSVMQFLIPWIVTFGAFGDFAGDGYVAKEGASPVFVQNAAFIWVPVMSTLAILAWIFMCNLPMHYRGKTVFGWLKYFWLEIIGFAGAGIGAYLLYWSKTTDYFIDPEKPPESGNDFPLDQITWTFVLMAIVILITLGMMRFGTPTAIREPLVKQFAIFRNKHNWTMTWLYVMTFGSFIGYSNAFPALIDNVFGFIYVGADGNLLPEPIKNPNAPVTASFIFLGAGVGALIRPVGGWLSDKLGGAKVTQWDTWIMVGATILAGYFVDQARHSQTPEEFFYPFLITFIVLFATTGIGNGSTFRMIPIIFSKEQAGPVLGWTSAVAAYGAFIIPMIVGSQIKAGRPEYALYGFAVYYASCLAVNWWYYARKGAEIPC
ncbi:MAG: hypothetical protein NUW37_08360 [Planctomycetes bacterium]|nr:hypothetical protein [Planctomycetota bacterium]